MQYLKANEFAKTRSIVVAYRVKLKAFITDQEDKEVNASC
jgi:hypothetical protein